MSAYRYRPDHQELTRGHAVVEMEFEGGPMDGRRLTAPAGIFTLYFHGVDDGGAPLVAAEPDPRRRPLGEYVCVRSYDCPERWELVLVMRWSAHLGDRP